MDSLVNLHKEMKQKEPKLTELQGILAVAQANFPINTEVAVSGTSHIGIVVSYNDNVQGFYPGTRYPIYVKITSSNTLGAVDCVFEYGMEQLVVV